MSKKQINQISRERFYQEANLHQLGFTIPENPNGNISFKVYASALNTKKVLVYLKIQLVNAIDQPNYIYIINQKLIK
jgi:hypothetical protein